MKTEALTKKTGENKGKARAERKTRQRLLKHNSYSLARIATQTEESQFRKHIKTPLISFLTLFAFLFVLSATSKFLTGSAKETVNTITVIVLVLFFLSLFAVFIANKGGHYLSNRRK